MLIAGKFYDGQQAGSREVQFRLCDDGCLIAVTSGFEKHHISQVKVSRRIGNTPRNIEFPEGAMFATRDNETLDTWLEQQGINRSWIHRLESNLRFAVTAVITVALLVTGFALWGIPWLSTRAAYALPPEINNYIGQGTLETLDKRVFETTTLDEDRRRVLADAFVDLIPKDSEEIDYRLIFRGGGFIGANAFALPDGVVVVTDELVKLAQNDEEILSILLHEIGHVVHRHSLRQVISHSSLIVMTTVITGDVNSAGSLIVALPNVLIDTSYSRAIETEADTYSLEQMQHLGIPTTRFADFMERLERCGVYLAAKENADASDGAEEPECENMDAAAEGQQPRHYNWLNYISTHPPSPQRIARFRLATQ